MKEILVRFAVLGLLAGVLLGGFVFPKPVWAGQDDGAPGLQTVRLQLKWKHQFQFAGFYAAIQQGYYRAAGLEVELIEAGHDQDPIDAVLEGKAEFGVGTSDILLRHAQGAQPVVLGVVFQHSPLVLLALRESGISGPGDLSGRTVMIEPGSAELWAYLKFEGVDLDSLTVIPHSFDPLDLAAGKAEAMSAYLTDELFELESLGLEYQVFTPRSAGIDFYGDNLFTGRDLADRDLDLIRRFREAGFQGWRYAMNHPEEMIELILAEYTTRKSREHLRFEYEQMVPLMAADQREIGSMSLCRWEQMVETYQSLGMLPADYSIDGLLFSEME